MPHNKCWHAWRGWSFWYACSHPLLAFERTPFKLIYILFWLWKLLSSSSSSLYTVHKGSSVDFDRYVPSSKGSSQLVTSFSIYLWTTMIPFLSLSPPPAHHKHASLLFAHTPTREEDDVRSLNKAHPPQQKHLLIYQSFLACLANHHLLLQFSLSLSLSLSFAFSFLSALLSLSLSLCVCVCVCVFSLCCVLHFSLSLSSSPPLCSLFFVVCVCVCVCWVGDRCAAWWRGGGRRPGRRAQEDQSDCNHRPPLPRRRPG